MFRHVFRNGSARCIVLAAGTVHSFTARRGERIICRSWIVRDRGRALELAGEARLEDGTLLAEGSGLFLRLPPGQRAEMERRIFGPDAERAG